MTVLAASFLPPRPVRPWLHTEADDLPSGLGSTRPTPVVKLRAQHGRLSHRLLLKLEEYNPTGSIKDRTARGLFNDLRLRGLLREDSMLVESSSGNLGVALAHLARATGLSFTAVVDPLITEQSRARLITLGANVITVTEPDSSGSYLNARLARVTELCASDDRYVWPNQYANPANPTIHYYETGAELLGQTPGDLDAVFVATSTCGTLAGVASAFRDHRPGVRVVAVDAAGSLIFGQPPQRRRLVGIGSSRSPQFDLTRLVDEVSIIADREAFAACHAMARVGLKLGGSSGAVLHAAARYLATAERPTTVAVLCPDSGANYDSSIYDFDWLTDAIGDPTGVIDAEALETFSGRVVVDGSEATLISLPPRHLPFPDTAVGCVA